MKYIIFSLLLLSFTALHAQNGWKDMGGYKETTDTTGEVLQIKPTTDGKYLYVLCTLMDSTVKKQAIQKWDVDSGRVVFSRFIDMKGYAWGNLNLNCDATSYSLYGKTSNPTKYRIIVRDNDTDTELLRAIDNEDMANRSVAQLDYDRGNKYFYIGYNSDFYSSNRGDDLLYSNGYITRKMLVDSVLSGEKIVAANTSKFIHTFNTNYLATLSFYRFLEHKSGVTTNYIDNYVNYIGMLGDTITLSSFRSNRTSTYTIALSPNGSMVSATNNDTKSTSIWFIDSLEHVSLLVSYPGSSNTQVFSRDNKYLIVNSPTDYTLTTINASMRTICGSITHPIVKMFTEIFSLPQSTTILAACTDKKFRLIESFKDTSARAYAINVDTTSIYQHNTVAFCPVIPSFDSSRIFWDFGDGRFSSSLSPLHRYDSAGVFDVTMRVTDNYGQHEVVRKKLIEVQPTPIPITLDFDADVRYGSAPLTVNFTNKSTGIIQSYQWSFDDGTTSTSKETLHTFNQQRSYSITLTVNDGNKDTSLTKYHYINADEYPAFPLKTKRTYSQNGSVFYHTNNEYTSRDNIFETMLRTGSGKVFLKTKVYEDLTHISSGMTTVICGVSTDVYTVNEDGTLLHRIGGTGADNNYYPNLPCVYNDATMGVLNLDLLSYFQYHVAKTGVPYTSVFNGSAGNQTKNYPFATFYYTVRALANGIDCFSFRNNNALEYTTTLCFYQDTTKLLAKDIINGYALPAIGARSDDMVSLVTMPQMHSQGTALQLRRYTKDCMFIDSTLIKGNSLESIYDILRMPNNKYLLCGDTPLRDTIYKNRRGGVFIIMDELGTIEYRKELPQWYSLKSITKMDDRTFAITGDPSYGTPGFIAVKSDGRIAGDFRADLSKGSPIGAYYVQIDPNAVNVCFGKTMRTVFFTRNDGYNAELYVSDNPYLQDISVSVDESPVTGRMIENQLTVSPNPTDGNSTLHYYSTTPQRITLTVTSLIGEVYRSQVLDVESGENTIPLDMTGFGSGVAFVTVAGVRDVQHAQVCVVR
ncbi:MAG: PKD domain-containing protein [Candidatus Kapaibacterium sp.]